MAEDLPFEGSLGPETRAGAVCTRAVATCGLADIVGDLAGAAPCIVVEDGVVLGVLEGDAFADPTRTAAEAMRAGPSTFRPALPRDELAAHLDEHGVSWTILTTPSGHLVGTVARTAL